MPVVARALAFGLLLVVAAPCASSQSGAPAGAPTAPKPPGRYATVDGANLYYEECSRGAPVHLVLLHDGLLHSVTWDEVWAPLCGSYHVLRYDRRGYGRSEPAKAPFSPEDDLVQLMRRAQMDRAILVGNSSGAGLAVDFALAHPEMVEGLFLIGPVVHGMSSSAYFVDRGNKAMAPLAQGDVKTTAENWSRDPYLISGARPEARKKLLETLLQSPQNMKAGGQFEIRPSPPTVSRLGQIQAPTLVLVGDADIADVVAYAGAIEAALPIAFFEVWKDAGHLIQLERPTDLVDRVRRFVSLADRREVSVPSETLRAYVGSYRFRDRTIGISIRNARLELKLPDFPEKPLFAASPSRFFVRTTMTEFQFERGADGKVTQLVIYNADGSKIECPRS